MKKIIFNILLINFLLIGLINGQCFPDRHNTTWYDGWVSCEASDNPNVDRGNGHWILYNFGEVYRLTNTHVWNLNNPDNLDWGVREVVIDCSYDGVEWNELGTFEFDMATGKSNYEGFDGPDFDETQCQYVLITALNNHGGDCFGFSEMRFGISSQPVSVEEVNDNWCLSVSTYPNPFVSSTNLELSTNCAEDVHYSVTDALGKKIIPEVKLTKGTYNIDLDFSALDLPAGIYMLNVRQDKVRKQYRLMKMSDQ